MLEKNFIQALESLRLDLSSNKTIAVAFSGGSDSLALLLLLKLHYPETTMALTVNHNLRTESGEESKKCQEFAKKLGISHHILNWHHEGVSSNIQEKARKARYNLLTEFCAQNKIEYLFVAHNKNDVAETFMTNLFRGSGIYGLSAIPAISSYNNIKIIRPLLSFDKITLQTFLKKQKLNWIEDPSNQKEYFLRTKIRKLLTSKEMTDIMPDPALLTDRIVLAANNLARAREELERSCHIFIKNEVQFFNEGYARINYDSFLEISKEISLKVLASCLMAISCNSDHQPRLSSLEILFENILLKKSPQTLHGCEVLVKNKDIYLYREIGRATPMAKKIADNRWVWDNRFEIIDHSDQIQEITSPAPQDVSKEKTPNHTKFPRKIWKSLPLIITYDSKRLVPFLNSGEYKNFSVKFIGGFLYVDCKSDFDSTLADSDNL